jgi:hypothetical protein
MLWEFKGKGISVNFSNREGHLENYYEHLLLKNEQDLNLWWSREVKPFIGRPPKDNKYCVIAEGGKITYSFFLPHISNSSQSQGPAESMP